MSSDADYASFLDKANQDTGTSRVSSKPGTATTKGVDSDVPKALQDVEQYYVSEADEPFEPVSLKWTGKHLPSEDEFRDLIDHNADISIVDPEEFDPRREYKEVIEAVKIAGGKDFRVFRIHHGKTRAEYYVVSLDLKGSKIVGLKAKAVES
ncbi:MAG: hypothetical protein M1827_005037 [Pycnora praestabilis]|nr:MAG: hypothetical protein M1827_005037 [Pycnora praestabilis]